MCNVECWDEFTNGATIQAIKQLILKDLFNANLTEVGRVLLFDQVPFSVH